MLGVILSIYIGSLLLLNIPFVQQKISVFVANSLTEILETKVVIGNINVGFLNRIIIDDLLIEDRFREEMIKVSRLSAKFDFWGLLKEKQLSISSVQLFGFNINLHRETPESELNLQFVLDTFASDNVQADKGIDLRINSFLIRRGRFAYDVLSEEETPGVFNPKHIKLYNIIGNISLKALQSDSINAQIKRLSMDEQSGLELQKLNLKVVGNQTNMLLDNFVVELPNTSLKMDAIELTYDGSEAFSDLLTNVHFDFKVKPSHVTLHDISPFVPAFAYFKEKINIEMEANGTLDQLNCPKLLITSENRLTINGSLSLQDLSRPSDAFIYGSLSRFYANRDGVDFLVRNFSKKYDETPELLKHLGDISFKGEISGYFNDLVTYGTFQTDLGEVKSDMKLSTDNEKNTLFYSGGVKTEEFEIGKLLNNSKLGKTSLDVNIQGKHRKQEYPEAVLKGMISSLEYSDYEYENISMDGEYVNGGFDGKINLDDENGSVSLNGNINLQTKVPNFNFTADIINFRPYDLNLLPESYEGSDFSMKLKADFTGGHIDEMEGGIFIDSLVFLSPTDNYSMDKMRIISTHVKHKKVLTLDSEFMKARIEGDYSYRTLPVSMTNMIKKYVPSFFPPAKKEIETSNNFSFDIDLFDTEILPSLFHIPFTIYSHSIVKGYFNDHTNSMRLEGYFPQFRYDDTFMESGLLLCENSKDQLKGKVRLSSHRKKEVVNLSMEAQAQNDQLDTRISWGNSGTATYSGNLEASADFSRQGEGKRSILKSVIDIKPTDVILNDTIWKVHPSHIVADSGKVHIDNFYFSHEDQYLRIDGKLSENLSDTVKVDLNDISIEYVFDLINFKSVDFKGYATGSAMACRAFKKPEITTSLFVKNFYFNDGLIGDMNITGDWNQQQEGIWVDAHMKREEISETFVNGYIYPLAPKSGLDLNIRTSNIDVRFLETYVDGFATDLSGHVSGKVRLYGAFSDLNLDGETDADVRFKVDVLNTYFTLKDSIHIDPQEISFRDVALYDAEGHEGTINGYLRHQHFRDMNYRFDINVANMLMMNTEENPDFPFYATLYATGNATMLGNGEGLDINAAITTRRNTTLTYELAPTMSAASSQFIKFVDRTPKGVYQDSILLSSDFQLAMEQQQKEEEELDLDIRLNIQIEATPDATFRVIMDPISGDYMQGKGRGSIRMEFFNKGDVKLFGSYTVDQGVYKLSIQEVIRKDFVMRSGSSVTFAGDPENAVLDLQTAHTVSAVSLNDLIPSNELDAVRISNTSVKVNCLMNIGSRLSNPIITFGIELPNERDEVQSLVRNYVNTEEEINMQILYLLGIGKFYPPDYLTTGQNSNLMSSVLSSTLSGQLNNMLSQILEINNWNIGTNLSTGEKGWTELEMEAVLSGQLLNNRLIINGNFGYRDNPMATTNFVGDFEAEWLLTRSGDIRLKAYNQTNDRYYTRTNLTTQGIGIIYRKDFYKWNELYFWQKIGRKKREAKEKQSSPAGNTSAESVSWIEYK